MGRLWDLIEAYRDEQRWPPSYRAMARGVGVTATAFTNWREPKRLPDVDNLHALAELIGVSYSRVLEAALTDAGYRERTTGGQDPAPTKPARSALAPESVVTDEGLDFPGDMPPASPSPGRVPAPRRSNRPGSASPADS